MPRVVLIHRGPPPALDSPALEAMALLDWAVDPLGAGPGPVHPPRRPGEPPPVLVVDARDQLATHRELARELASTHPDCARLVVLRPEDLAAWTSRWEADDLLLSTAGPGEVTARVRVAAQRAAVRRGTDEGSAGPGAPPAEDADRIDLGELVIHRDSWSARLRGRTLDLTFREFELLAHLAAHPGRVFTREELLDDLWEGTRLSGTRTVDVHVRRLRSKLGPEHEGLIATVRNVGYRMEARG
ncbi:winged helix-turn-helix domain-containing protein [Kytococcus sedentarius]|uniref:winged helix-turn-helix domain-containing protein n=1 Tax=Kytococcus sedentarius TaxID=1276 RepID=UPI0035BC6068